MTSFVRRLVVFAALVAGAAALFTAPAGARTAPAGGPSVSKVARSLAYVQPLNESENGEALFFGCGVIFGGSVTGSPISNGEFFGILEVDCSGPPGACVDAAGFVDLSDSNGEIDKNQSGKVCITSAGPGGITLVFEGTYTISAGFGRYQAAQGTGKVSMTFDCAFSVFCGVSGTEKSAAPEESAAKKGNDPEHVLLCSPELVTRADGTAGNALQVPYADYAAWLVDPTTHPEIPTGSIPAKYGQDIGLTCDDLPGYANSGKFVDATGTMPDEGTTDPGALYPYWVKA